MYVFLMLLLLTASGSMGDECPSPSGAFKGPCINLREGECNRKCIDEDHQTRGECSDDIELKCYCYHPC
ncbi:hypothetical protein SUGI_0909270 [Cryptomeria japonica]|nr:hypothetical protein SUGI_0909270 [Cryptomeria japonica]